MIPWFHSASVHGCGDGGVLSQCRALSCSYPHPNYLSGKQKKNPNKFRFTFVWVFRLVFVNIFLPYQIHPFLGTLGWARLSLSQQNSAWSSENQALPFHLSCRNENNAFGVLAFASEQGTFQRDAELVSFSHRPSSLFIENKGCRKNWLLEKSHFLWFSHSLTGHSSWRDLHVQNNATRRPPRAKSHLNHLNPEQARKMWIIQLPFRSSVTQGWSGHRHPEKTHPAMLNSSLNFKGGREWPRWSLSGNKDLRVPVPGIFLLMLTGTRNVAENVFFQ